MAEALTTAWGDWIANNGPWHLFGALTYDQERRPLDRFGDHAPPPADINRAHVRRWLRDGSRALAGRIEAGVIALEYQKNGWPHFHPLLRLSGGLQGNEFAQLGQAWFRKHGYARLEAPRDQSDVSAYAAKYLVKDLARGDVTFWPLVGGWPAHQPGLSARAAAGR